MCVTNISKRRNVAVDNASDAMAARTPSLISQRLMGNFMPMMFNNTTPTKPLGGSTNSTGDTVGEPSRTTSASFSNPALNSCLPNQNTASNLGGGDEKVRPKRRRKPQKPGKTAKHNDRHFVVHNYHDHALDPDENDEHLEHEEENGSRRRGGASTSFPAKLHAILDQVEADGLAQIVSWQPHGRCFAIHKPREFSEHVMPHYFGQSKITSFQRQLNLYGFVRITRGQDTGGYYHERFLRGRVFLTKKMQRTKIKGTKFKAASSPEQEPDFYCMPPVGTVPHPVSDDSSADTGNAAGRISPVVFTSNGSYFAHDMAQVSPTFSVEPLPVQLPRSHPLPSMAFFSPLDASFNPTPMRKISDADEILDEAVDELFNNNNSFKSDDISFDQIWDSAEFCDESFEDDLNLGFMLEKLLNE